MSQASAPSRFDPELKRIQESPAARDRDELFRLCLAAAPAEGMICEFGVGNGDTLYILAEMIAPRMIYGFDSFLGLPEDWNVSSRDWATGLRKGDFGPTPGVRYQVAEPPVSERNIEIVRGWFEEALPPFLAAHPEPCAFVHMDSAIYSATKSVLDDLADHLTVGTVFQFDELYNFVGFEDHEYKAFFEFVERTGVSFEYLGHCPPLREGESDAGRTDRQVAVRITGLPTRS